jgi:hypothetical protein
MKRGLLSSSPPACNAPVGTLFPLVGTLFYIFDVLDLKSEKCHILCEEKNIYLNYFTATESNIIHWPNK